MSRMLIKESSNAQRARKGFPYQTWTRRVRWYEDDASVRLKFEDMRGIYFKVYNLPIQLQEAQADYDKFRKGESVKDCVGGRETTTEEK